MKSELSDLASLAEIIGAVAIVVSLIYVGIQVNDSNRAIRSAAVNDANVSVQACLDAMVHWVGVLRKAKFQAHSCPTDIYR